VALVVTGAAALVYGDRVVSDVDGYYLSIEPPIQDDDAMRAGVDDAPSTTKQGHIILLDIGRIPKYRNASGQPSCGQI
jgi:hypothetical protein